MSSEPAQALQNTNESSQPAEGVGETTTNVEVGQQQSGDNGSSDQYYSYGIFKQRLRIDPLCVVFIILLLIGGLIGYISKGSLISIISSVIFAIVLAAGTYLEGVRRNPYPLIVTLVALFGMMLYRAIMSGSFMPAGLVATLTLIMLARHSYFVYARRQLSQA